MSLISVEEAFERVVGDAGPLGETETVELHAASKRTLARDLLALRTQPGFDASAMDGYAVRSADCMQAGRELALIGESAAGRAFPGAVDTGECVRIFTGARLPDGADAILIQENAERIGPLIVRTGGVVSAGRHVRKAGADFAEGSLLAPALSRLTSAGIALAASGGHSSLEVLRRPRVAILATGDELVPPGMAVGPSQTVASNSYGIAAIVRGVGGEALDYGIATDSMDVIAGFVDRAVAEKVDVLVTIGGASVGDHDLVGRVLEARGMVLDFWKVAMRPGKPLMAGRIGSMRVLGLPGNPASSLVAATLFLRPLVEALGGMNRPVVYRDGILGADMPENDERADFIRATLSDRAAVTPIVTPAGRQDSSLLSVFAAANALLVREPRAPAAATGDRCRFVTLD